MKILITKTNRCAYCRRKFNADEDIWDITLGGLVAMSLCDYCYYLKWDGD